VRSRASRFPVRSDRRLGKKKSEDRQPAGGKSAHEGGGPIVSSRPGVIAAAAEASMNPPDCGGPLAGTPTLTPSRVAVRRPSRGDSVEAGMVRSIEFRFDASLSRRVCCGLAARERRQPRVDCTEQHRRSGGGPGAGAKPMGPSAA